VSREIELRKTIIIGVLSIGLLAQTLLRLPDNKKMFTLSAELSDERRKSAELENKLDVYRTAEIQVYYVVEWKNNETGNWEAVAGAEANKKREYAEEEKRQDQADNPGVEFRIAEYRRV
jgi:hypothetical protein